MKNTTEILLKSRENQLAVDACIQTLVKHSFDGDVVSGIKTYGAAVINYLRDIEDELYAKLGISYTPETYDPAVAYMVSVELPQLSTAYWIKQYYITRLTDIVTDMILDTDNDGVLSNNNFIGDNTGSPNSIFQKGATWTTKEQLAIDRLNDIIDTLEAYTADQS